MNIFINTSYAIKVLPKSPHIRSNRHKQKQAFFTKKKACFTYLMRVIISLQVRLLQSLVEQSVP